MTIYIAIPRFALSGGNLVSLELAKYLESQGYLVYCISGFRSVKPSSVILRKPRRGKINSFANIYDYLITSFRALFYKNYIATHHLTSVFNFIKKSKFSLVQDVEVDFYPARIKFIGKLFWKNYLLSKNLIFTNQILCSRIIPEHNTDIEGLSFVPFTMDSNHDTSKTIDVLGIIRDGQYKDPQKTLEVINLIERKGWNVKVINASRQQITNNNTINNCNREQFLKLLNRTKVFICLSKWEGLGLPNLEAFVAGCEIVSTPIPSAVTLKAVMSESIVIVNDANSNESIVDVVTMLLSGYANNSINTTERMRLLHEQYSKWLNYAERAINKGISK